MAKQQRSRASARTPCRPGWGAASCPQEAHGRHAPATAASMALAHSTSPSSRTSPESWGLSSPSRPRKSSAADALLPSSIGPSLAAKASLAPTSSLRSLEHVPASEHVDEVTQEKVSGRGHCSKPPPPVRRLKSAVGIAAPSALGLRLFVIRSVLGSAHHAVGCETQRLAARCRFKPPPWASTEPVVRGMVLARPCSPGDVGPHSARARSNMRSDDRADASHALPSLRKDGVGVAHAQELRRHSGARGRGGRHRLARSHGRSLHDRCQHSKQRWRCVREGGFGPTGHLDRSLSQHGYGVSVCLSVCLSIYLSVCLSVCVCVHSVFCMS